MKGALRPIVAGLGFALLAMSQADVALGADAPKPSPIAGDDPRMVAGQAIYTDTCMACHGASGDGVRRLFPSLAGSEVVQQADAAWPIAMVLQGGRAPATDAAPTGPAMPSLGWRLSNAEIADVLTYLRNSWGNAAPAVTANAVAALRQ